MRIQAIICDIDGSLMNPSSGLYVSKPIQDRIIELEQKGMLVILNSARTFQGVEPLARQLKLDEFGGYIISCNGCHIYDMKTKSTVFEYTIDQKTCLQMWDISKKYNLVPGFTQPDYVVCEEMSKGYYLDKETCQVDYMVSHVPQKHSTHSIWKCTISQTKELLDEYYESCRQEIVKDLDVNIVRSTPYMVDIVNADSDKLVACTRLLQMLKIDWQNVSVIGDGYADLECVREAGFGVSLENAKPEVKAVAKMIVPSCFEDGAIVWLDALLEENV